jgi:uncharacterized protein YndB with AHSA1/START domain
MADILHKVGVRFASIGDVSKALTTIEGLSGWWTTDTKGDAGPGGVIQFRFPPGGFDMKVEKADPAHVLWRVIEGPEDWVGTTIDWTLKEEGEYVIVLFRHQGWREPTESMHHCSTKWGVFMLSLKTLLETGKGAPSPRDVKIDNWN